MRTILVFKFALLFVIALMINSCVVNPKKNIEKNPTTTIIQDSLAFEVCRMYGADQGIRDFRFIKKNKHWRKIMPSIDSISFFNLVDFIKKNGYPDEQLLGKRNFEANECVELAPVAILLHTPHMLVNNKEYLDFFLKQVEEGKMSREFLALVLDKYYLRKDSLGNRRLLYGSQFGKPCLKYRAKSDSARAQIGLPPLVDSMFIKCK
ncbi:hypothetical protein [Ornithobacterium rhinotracheale]|uniref:hypothetical protein n=1 Tax=Ornithobacterium rhinotracheale TaxID=28251 RepID=UPI003FD609F9